MSCKKRRLVITPRKLFVIPASFWQGSLFALFILLCFTNLYSQKNSFPYPVPENNFISFSDTNFHSAYLKIFNRDKQDFYFCISTGKNKCLSAAGENYINSGYENFFLVNFNFAFLTLKYNVIPYLHPDFAIKFLFILNKIKYLPRVSDAMRTVENQQKYKRRGWSNVDDSPHLLGLAADLSYFTRSDREIIQKYNTPLGIRFLEHGRRGNHHIHLQDDVIWLLNKDSDVGGISEAMNKRISENHNTLMPYSNILFTENFKDGIEINFNTDKLDLIKIEFLSPLGKKSAELSAGIFEKGTHTLHIRTDFLSSGLYCIRVFKNGMYLYQKNVIKL